MIQECRALGIRVVIDTTKNDGISSYVFSYILYFWWNEVY